MCSHFLAWLLPIDCRSVFIKADANPSTAFSYISLSTVFFVTEDSIYHSEEMKFLEILKIGPLELCRNEFQSTGSHKLTVCTGTDSCYCISAYTWGQKRNTFLQGSSGLIFRIPKNVISYEPTELTFE